MVDKKPEGFSLKMQILHASYVQKGRDSTTYKLHRSNNSHIWNEPKEFLLDAKVGDEHIRIDDVIYDASCFAEVFTIMEAIVKDQKKLIGKRKYRK